MASPLANPPTHIQQNLQPGKIPLRTHRPLSLPEPLRLWHLTSLDAPTVAVVWSLAFARVANVRLPFWVPVLLALGTWAVYIGDRLLDANSAMRCGDLSLLRERHYFHWTHRRGLTSLALAAAAASAAIVVFVMPAGIRRHDTILAVAALAYFSGIHIPRSPRHWLRLVLSKELLVGFLFTAGCAIPTLSRMSAQGGYERVWPLFTAIVFFALLAWLNCYAIDGWESGAAFTITASGCTLALAALLLAFVLLCSGSAYAAALPALCSLSAFLIVALDRNREHLRPVTLRTAADLVLLTPLVLWIR